MKCDMDISCINVIEIYDDEIRYDGTTIWRGAKRYKDASEVDAIVKAYEAAKALDPIPNKR